MRRRVLCLARPLLRDSLLPARPAPLARLANSAELSPRSFCRPLPAARTMASMGQPAPFTVAFCGTEFRDAAVFTAALLGREPGFEVVACERSAVASALAHADLAVPLMCRLDAGLLASATRLRCVLQFGVGLEGVDLDACRARGIRVANIPAGGTGNAAACAEMALLLTLSLLRDVKGMAQSVAQRRLGSPTGVLLRGRSALLVGWGAIAWETAPRLAALGVRVSALRRAPWPSAAASASRGDDDDPAAAALVERGTWPGDLERLLGAHDVVVLTCTLNDSTRGLADARFLAAMRPGALLVNVARGGLVVEDAVLAALRSGHLGACPMPRPHCGWREMAVGVWPEREGVSPLPALPLSYSLSTARRVRQRRGVQRAGRPGQRAGLSPALHAHAPRRGRHRRVIRRHGRDRGRRGEAGQCRPSAGA